MTPQQAADYVRMNQARTKGRFKAVSKDGSWELVSLGVLPSGALVERPKGVRRYGFPLDPERVEAWESLERVFNRAEPLAAARRNLSRASAMLESSGLWPEVREDAEKLLALPADRFAELAAAAAQGQGAWSQARERLCPAGPGALTAAEVDAMSMPDAIRLLDYPPARRDALRASLRQALEKGSGKVSWHHRRDNTAQCGGGRGWYVEERSDRSDSRPYILLDESHALPDPTGARAPGLE